jgi:large-conductance mechanosensitive channel
MNHLVKPITFSQKIKLFLNNKTGTLIAAAMALCIGFAFKDLIATTVTAIIEPLIIYFLYVTRLEKIYDFKQFISKQNNTLNVSRFIQTLLTFIIIIIIVYNLFQHIAS